MLEAGRNALQTNDHSDANHERGNGQRRSALGSGDIAPPEAPLAAVESCHEGTEETFQEADGHRDDQRRAQQEDEDTGGPDGVNCLRPKGDDV